MVSRMLSQWILDQRSGEYDMGFDTTDEDVLCTRIADTFNPEEILDILGLDSEETVEALRSYIIDNADKFRAYLEDAE